MTTRVIIAGGGFGGLEAAFSLRSLLKRSPAITLIDRSPYHSFIPSIRFIVSGTIRPEEIRIPLKAVLGAAGIRFMQDEVLTLDPEKREVITPNGSLHYDQLVLATGAETNFFGIPGAEEYSCRFRAPDDAERIRPRLSALLDDSESPCRIAVAGAGMEGIELIGELIDFIRGKKDQDGLRTGRISIELIEGKTRLLPNLPAEVQDRVEKYLREQEVALSLGDGIVKVTKDSVLLASGRKRDYSMLIWSGGIQPSKLIRGLPFQKDPWGWLKVTDRLHVFDDRRIYGIGDAVSIYTGDGPLALPRLAYHAQDQARVASINAAAGPGAGRQIRYEPKNKPQLISLGKKMGILMIGDRIYAGSWVIPLKKALERNHIMTYLARPVSSVISSRLPGFGTLQRLRIKLPV